MKNDKYLQNLENIVKQIIQPLRNLPFNLVIESLYGSKVLPFYSNLKENKILLQKLISVAKNAGKEINKNGIFSKRPNEVGNYIEKYVKDALIKSSYIPLSKVTGSGKSKSTGYPDLQFVDDFNRFCYLECKTFNIENVNTTHRSFYLSPSTDHKVTKDGFHFVLSFQVEKFSNFYKCNSYKIISIYNLSCDIKHEFNSDNRRLYSKDLLLAEGKLKI